MEINTVRFGTIPVQEDKVLTFPKGILGFSNNKQFVLFPHTEGSPFFWLQSVDDGSLAFVVMNPQLVKKDYSINIEENVLEELDAKGTSDLDVMCIVTIPHNQPQKMTINLLGPIIINADKRCALQIVCTEETYSHRHPVLAEEQ
ncbi:MAG TPA: flagellar assembly protein FliW [Deltaproteobacteria bacterium]|nr:flagellar assembly protein FliW [Deltaproteobacteria bacterium]HPJ94028.1 flagellar assembly protein FliW [Deltaproteobacteria bacterium]HPR52300.1 flagellar assembly protein FliW [Deltaproteobacteria bacterium]